MSEVAGLLRVAFLLLGRLVRFAGLLVLRLLLVRVGVAGLLRWWGEGFGCGAVMERVSGGGGIG